MSIAFPRLADMLAAHGGQLPPLAGGSDELDPTATDVQPLEGQGAPTAEPTTSEVQPESQGRQDESTGLYDLSSVPEEFRPEVERIAKDIDRHVQAKLREAADYRKQWSPYEQLGLNEVGAEELQPIVELARALGSEDGDTAQRVILELAKAAGLEVEGLEDEEPPADDADPLSPLEQRLAALEQEREQERQAIALQEATQQELQRLAAEWGEVEEQHGRAFNEGEAELLRSLAERFDDSEEPIKTAYALMNQIMGLGEKGLVEAQAKQPKAAEPAGRASTAVDPPDQWDVAERLFRERNAQSAAA